MSTKLMGAPYMLGNHDLIRYKHLRIWTERGLIRVEDDRDGSYEIMSVSDAAARARAIVEIIKYRRSLPGWRKYFDELEAMQNLVDKMVDLLQKSREQGMPSDPSACREYVRRRPVSVSVPASISKDFDM